MLNEKELYARLSKRVAPFVGRVQSPGELTDAMSLEGDLGVDSARLIDIVLDIESEFGITLEDSLIEKFKTVGDVVAIIRQKAGAEESATAAGEAG
jgi:acyl carrier protein